MSVTRPSPWTSARTTPLSSTFPSARAGAISDAAPYAGCSVVQPSPPIGGVATSTRHSGGPSAITRNFAFGLRAMIASTSRFDCSTSILPSSTGPNARRIVVTRPPSTAMPLMYSSPRRRELIVGTMRASCSPRSVMSTTRCASVPSTCAGAIAPSGARNASPFGPPGGVSVTSRTPPRARGDGFHATIDSDVISLVSTFAASASIASAVTRSAIRAACWYRAST